MEVVGYDPYADRSLLSPDIITTELVELLSTSTFVVLACPYTPETRHLINDRTLALMRSDSFVVNVARGPVVEEEALVRALTAFTIAGAGLDVFEVEPLPSDSPLRTLPNVVLGAHNGSNTREGVARASRIAVDLLLQGLGHDD